jgi:hypothetical protein
MRRIPVALALIAAAGLLTAGAGSASPSDGGASAAKKKRPACKRGFVRRGKRCVRKPAPVIRGGRYGGASGQVGITMDIDTVRKVIEFYYGPYPIPCTTSRGVKINDNAPSGPSVPKGKLTSAKIGSSFSYTGTRSEKRTTGRGYYETITTTWTATGRFPTARKVTGSLHVVLNHSGDDNPDPLYRVGPYACDSTVPFTLNAT